MPKQAEDGRQIRRANDTDPIGEVTYCGACLRQINWASDALFGVENYDSVEDWEASRDNTDCPFCGSADTKWIPV